MRQTLCAILLIVWFVCTLILVCTLIGVFFLAEDKSWSDIGEDLARGVTES